MADRLSISSKSTRRLHKLAQKLGSHSPKPSSSNGPGGSGAPELATVLSDFTRKSQISPPAPQKQGHPTCAAVSGPIEPKPDPSAGPLEPDSGYGSSESTLATTTGPEKSRSKPTLSVFPKTVPTDVQNRFNDLRVLYAPALLEAVAKTKARNISMKLKYLGQSEETAKLYIVVQCDPGIVKKVERFLSQKHVLEDLGSDFLVDVRGGTLLSLSGSVTIGIWGILEAKATFCGMPILISSGDARQRATFGGLISVAMTRKRTVLYGVTAAHPAAALIPRPMSGVDADDCDSDSEEPSQPLLDPGTEVSISQQVEESDALGSESKNLGTITERGVFRTRDLALIELECEELLPNRISPFQPTAKGGGQRSMADTRMLYRSRDLFASDFQKHSFQACPAAVLTSRGLQYGQISSSRSALTMFLDAEFIEVFDFCPNQGAMYGHVVSTDAFGEASVIPIQTSLDAIKEQLHARNVRLPTARRISQLQVKRKISISVEATEPVKGNPSSAIPPEEQDARKSDETRNPKTKPQLNSVVDALSKLDATKTLDLQRPGRHSPLFEILDVGWGMANDAHQQYLGLKQDVEGLKGQLESLRFAINIIRTRTGTLLEPGQAPQQLKQIFGDFKKPLEDCWRLLERQVPYVQGPVYNLLEFLRVKDEVDIHRTRIAILSSKLSLARHSMEM
ncbi:hypothetical protein NEMBOFW57_005087 [Staphylotrichum longicolle]|uniref:Uncharacterized protein n=1 Tax=Staphylotrichum longicolle TaxID=669026 RepID=A0AAD4EW17_9PEZI|nr:hypothetical protein NEMBOFW57_005087 [Staphylotrichum longicolle]